MATSEQTSAANGTQITPARSKEVRVVQDNGPVAHLMDTARFEHTYRIATAMAAAALIPDHLVGVKRGGQFHPYSQTQVVGNCFLVVNQSLRWGIDPFSAMAETYAVGGKLGFQGKLIAALINARAGLKQRLRYEFDGKGDDLTVTVSGVFEGETAPRTVTLSVGQAKTDNQMWKKDPEQKLIYSGATKWARRHCPEIMLGVLTDDDLEHITINAQSVDLVSKPATSLEDLTQQFGARPEAVDDGQRQYAAHEGPTDEASQGEAPDDVDQRTEEEKADEALRLPAEHPLYELQAMLDVADTLGAVNKAQQSYKGPDSDQLLWSMVDKLAEARREKIRSGRGK